MYNFDIRVNHAKTDVIAHLIDSNAKSFIINNLIFYLNSKQ